MPYEYDQDREEVRRDKAEWVKWLESSHERRQVILDWLHGIEIPEGFEAEILAKFSDWNQAERRSCTFEAMAMARCVTSAVTKGRIPTELDRNSFLKHSTVDRKAMARVVDECLSRVRVFQVPCEALHLSSYRAKILENQITEEVASDCGVEMPDPELFEEWYMAESEDKDALKELLIERFDQCTQIGLPDQLPFPTMLILTSPPSVLTESGWVKWKGPVTQMMPGKDHYFCGWLVDQPKGLVFDMIGLSDEGSQAYVKKDFYTMGLETLYIRGKGWIHGAPRCQQVWNFHQIIEMINNQRSIVLDKPSRLVTSRAVKKAWSGDLRKQRPTRPPDYYEVRVQTTIRESLSSTPRADQFGDPRNHMVDYHTDRRGHERILVRSIPSSTPTDQLQEWIHLWTARGYWVFEKPNRQVEVSLEMDLRKAGLQAVDEVRAIKVTWVDEHFIGNLDAPYVPSLRTLSVDTIMDAFVS